MKRRQFLSLLGAASLAPTLPSVGVSAPTAAMGYNRYMYGLGVFHARTRAGITAPDLMARLKISAVQADAMMGEMTASGVFSPITGQVSQTIVTRSRKPYVRKALRHLHEQVKCLNENADVSEEMPENPDAALRRCTNGAQAVPHRCHPIDQSEPTTSCGPKLGVH